MPNCLKRLSLFGDGWDRVASKRAQQSLANTNMLLGQGQHKTSIEWYNCCIQSMHVEMNYSNYCIKNIVPTCASSWWIIDVTKVCIWLCCECCKHPRGKAFWELLGCHSTVSRSTRYRSHLVTSPAESIILHRTLMYQLILGRNLWSESGLNTHQQVHNFVSKFRSHPR